MYPATAQKQDLFRCTPRSPRHHFCHRQRRHERQSHPCTLFLSHHSCSTRFTSLQRSNLLYFLTSPCQFPILFKVIKTQVYPLSHEPCRRLRIQSSLHDIAVEIKDRFIALILSMEMWRVMFIKEHSNDNSEESANLWHGSSFLHLLPTKKSAVSVASPLDCLDTQ